MKTAVILGGTNDHIALINNLKKRGYFTYLIDYLNNPPAKSYADLHIQESTLDLEKVKSITSDLNADLIISACIDQALCTACYVAEQLNLPSPFSYKEALLVTNKSFMKSKMVESNIPTSKYKIISNFKDLEGIELNYPLMIKPVDSNGSTGVRKINNESELLFQYNDTKSLSRTSEVIIEEYYQKGIEVSADAIITNDGRVDLLMYGRLKKKVIDDKINLIISNNIPADINQQCIDKIKSIIGQISKTFNIKNSPILIQTIICENEVNVIEFSPRIGGGSKHKTIKLKTGVDIIDVTIDSFLGLDIKIDKHPNEKMFSRNHIYCKEGILGEIIGLDNLLNKQIIDEYSIYKEKGSEIHRNFASKDRVGSFLVSGNNQEEIETKINFTLNFIDVIDISGKSIIDREMYYGNII